ncbi:MAG: tRNA (adenosine(37)-N6)-threonylcarbamoyltransferase complex ATPase subunit type 1 TsaE [Planctomycetota bacterium]
MIRLAFELDGLVRTEAFGRALAGVVRTGDVVLLDGELGAGKTTLVRAVCAGLSIDDGAVSSPTYVIVHQYEGQAHGIRVPVAHLDAYRLGGEDAEELELLGWDRFAAESVVLIEWGERVAGVLADMGMGPIARLGLMATGETSRAVSLAVPRAWAEREGWAAVAALGDGTGEEMNNDQSGSHEDERREDTVCRVTGHAVPADSPTWPFANERARLADLYKWFSEGYSVSRPLDMSDLEETE